MPQAQSYSGESAMFGSVQTVGEAGVFGQVMGLVAVTVAFFTLGAYLGRDFSGGPAMVCFFIGFGCIIGLNFARRSQALAVTLLFAGGLALGLGLGGGLDAYAETAPGVVYQAAGATALFVGALASIGYSIRKDLSAGYRILFVALLGLIVVGFISLFVSIPGGNIVYSVAGLVIFGGYTLLDFNRMRRAGMEETVPLAAGIFLDVLNIFLFFLRIFGGRQ
jgi:FtsH-binding integral membrane protein